ncbi:CrcB family protein [Demequina sp. NBRC 110054]|uniref:fluoride efflux transporter FluC n=1 Tax=Demequina sp. NBRC 110054 TaxID=1570343 RepID=UPI001356526F|nr:CrcB family protein [Demequina sp. NBRC 110054]
MGRTLTLVWAGGFVGGVLRLLVGQALPHATGTMPWDLVLVNVVGSLVLGFVVSRAQREGGWAIFPAIGPGLLGGFTTFSSVAVLTWGVDAAHPANWLLLGVLMLLAVASAALGWWLGGLEAGREEAVHVGGDER